MTQAYRIVDWARFYEVGIDGHAVGRWDPVPPMDRRRKSPLRYIRIENTGHKQTTVDRKIIGKTRAAPGEAVEMAVHGFFVEMLKLAGDQPREFRGWILDERQRPMDVKAIADQLGIFEIGTARMLLGILTDPDIGLMEVCEFRQTCAEMRKSPDECALFKNVTEEKNNLNEEKEASDCSHNVSDSKIKQAREKTVRQVCELLWINPQNPSDITTFRNIFDQIEDRIISGELTNQIWDCVVDEARDAVSHRFGKMGRFINAMKREPFCYVPERRRVAGFKW